MNNSKNNNITTSFTFEDIFGLDNNKIKVILKELEFPTIALALKGTSEKNQEKIFSILSKRDESMVKEDMEFFDSVNKKDIEDAQMEILQKIYNLTKKGNISLK